MVSVQSGYYRVLKSLTLNEGGKKVPWEGAEKGSKTSWHWPMKQPLLHINWLNGQHVFVLGHMSVFQFTISVFVPLKKTWDIPATQLTVTFWSRRTSEIQTKTYVSKSCWSCCCFRWFSKKQKFIRPFGDKLFRSLLRHKSRQVQLSSELSSRSSETVSSINGTIRHGGLSKLRGHRLQLQLVLSLSVWFPFCLNGTEEKLWLCPKAIPIYDLI